MTSPDIVATNRAFYDALWWRARLQRPDRFNTWPIVRELLPSSPRRLELGPGLRPRLPIAGTHFIDISEPAIAALNRRGGLASSGEIQTLPFDDGAFDLVCAFDVIEHVADGPAAFAEISRVLKPGGVFIFSVPVHAHQWTAFDDWVGHARRYEAADLRAILTSCRLSIEKSAAYGMAPSNPRWLDRGMWWLEHRRNWAMFWYNWVGMPLAMLFQKRLDWVDGLLDEGGVDEVAVVCHGLGDRPPAAGG